MVHAAGSGNGTGGRGDGNDDDFAKRMYRILDALAGEVESGLELLAGGCLADVASAASR